MTKLFEANKQSMQTEYSDIKWIESSGLSSQQLRKNIDEIICNNKETSTARLRADVFSYICNNAQIAVDKYDIFQDKIRDEGLMYTLLNSKKDSVKNNEMKKHSDLAEDNYNKGAWFAHEDFGHVCSDWDKLFKLGFRGILNQINDKLNDKSITDVQIEFYTTCKIFYESAIAYTKRLGEATLETNQENGKALLSLCNNAPQNIYEAIQLIFIYYYLHEKVSCARERTLGRIDKQLYRFYQNDILSGAFTKDEIREMIKYFLYKIWLLKVAFDLPMMLGGIDENGNEVTNELSYMIIEEYDRLNIYSPKIHIRVSDKTPKDFLMKVLSAIRKGNSSILLVNDNIAIPTLVNAGIKKEFAQNYILIGCYEPAAFGCEIPCTGNGTICIVKALEYALEEKITSFDDLLSNVYDHFKKFADDAMQVVSNWEKYYMKIYSDPLLSATFDSCMKNGKDAYDGGALYNNSSLNINGIGTLIDSFAIIHKYVYEDKKITLNEFKTILKSNWAGYESLRKEIMNCDYRYGNGCEFADKLTKQITSKVAGFINNKPNARGGVFKAGLYSIDHNVYYGSKTGATPDGRFSGDTLSKNLCPTAGMEFGGITEIIKSVSKIDATQFPNGTVLDLVFHPTTVSGDDGLMAMLGIYLTYFKLGGFAIHSNVFDASKLKLAQKEPEKYKNLQVRVCGWNVFFVNLSKKEQDDFIKQAEK